MTVPASAERSTEPAPKHPADRIGRLKDIFALVQSILTSAGIVAAAVWFFWQGQLEPKISLSHTVAHHRLDDRRSLIVLQVDIKNIGVKKVMLHKVRAYAQQVLPLTPALQKRLDSGETVVDANGNVTWDGIQGTLRVPALDLAIESQETDSIAFDFIVPSEIETVRLYTFLENPNNPKVGWTHTTFFDVKSGKIETTGQEPVAVTTTSTTPAR